jgi:hypothetical protein
MMKNQAMTSKCIELEEKIDLYFYEIEYFDGWLEMKLDSLGEL